ncbi:MAG: RNA polymerase sigma factor [Polyangiaceae bacterium]
MNDAVLPMGPDSDRGRAHEGLIPEAPLASDPPAPAAAVDPGRALRFRALVDANFDFIWRSLRGLGVPAHSVDDAVQHVFLVASQKLDSIAEGSERAFLYGTASGVAANARRSRARSREVLDESGLSRRADDALDGEQLVEMNERRALLDRALGGMGDDLREVFVLFVLEGMETPHIAQMLGVPRGTVASRLRRAREEFHSISKRLAARPAPRGRGGSR